MSIASVCTGSAWLGRRRLRRVVTRPRRAQQGPATIDGVSRVARFAEVKGALRLVSWNLAKGSGRSTRRWRTGVASGRCSVPWPRTSPCYRSAVRRTWRTKRRVGWRAGIAVSDCSSSCRADTSTRAISTRWPDHARSTAFHRSRDIQPTRWLPRTRRRGGHRTQRPRPLVAMRWLTPTVVAYLPAVPALTAWAEDLRAVW
jgi:hypothetical protein